MSCNSCAATSRRRSALEGAAFNSWECNSGCRHAMRALHSGTLHNHPASARRAAASTAAAGTPAPACQPAARVTYSDSEVFGEPNEECVCYEDGQRAQGGRDWCGECTGRVWRVTAMGVSAPPL